MLQKKKYPRMDAQKDLPLLDQRVYARLKETGMTIGELEALVEEKSGMFLKKGYLKKNLCRGRWLHKRVYVAIKEFLGEPV